MEELFFFSSPRKKLRQGQDYVIRAWPCVENDVLLHYLEEVSEQLDLQMAKSKPHSVIHACCKVYRDNKIILHPQKNSLGAVFACKLLHGAFRQGLYFPLYCYAPTERSGRD